MYKKFFYSIVICGLLFNTAIRCNGSENSQKSTQYAIGFGANVLLSIASTFKVYKAYNLLFGGTAMLDDARQHTEEKLIAYLVIGLSSLMNASLCSKVIWSKQDDEKKTQSSEKQHA